jgi:hypothetical protein
MAAPGETVSAATADNVAFAADQLTYGDVVYVRSYGDDFTDELVANREALSDG